MKAGGLYSMEFAPGRVESISPFLKIYGHRHVGITPRVSFVRGKPLHVLEINGGLSVTVTNEPV